MLPVDAVDAVASAVAVGFTIVVAAASDFKLIFSLIYYYDDDYDDVLNMPP